MFLNSYFKMITLLFTIMLSRTVNADNAIKWRSDLRCGPQISGPNECDPNSKSPCCSPLGWCGNTDRHCLCNGCMDYRAKKGPKKCERDFTKVGCFVRNNKVLTDLLITDLDPTHMNFTQHVDWDNYGDSLHSLACRCKEKAQGHYKYFGIGFYGECLAGKDNAGLETIFKDPERSVCINGNMEECDNDDITECAGTTDNDYFYEILQGNCSYNIANGNLLKLFHSQILIEKNKLVTIIPEMGTVYEISFEVFPISYCSGWGSILHMTSSGNSDKYGARIPGIWFYPSSPSAKTNKIYISNALIGEKSHYYVTKEFPLNKWIKIKLNQVRLETEYIYSIYINDEKVYRIKNTKPSYFSDVKVYTGDPWYPAQPGYIRNLQIAENCFKKSLNDKLALPSVTKLVKNTLVGTISKFCKEYTVSLEVKPTQFGTKWRSVFHMTLGGNYRAYGDRSPGIWFWPSNSNAAVNRLYISSPVSRNRNYACSTKYFPKNEWIKLKVTQQKVGSEFIYRVHVNGEEICSLKNTYPLIFYDMKAYAGDPWYGAQEGYVRNIEIDGGCRETGNNYPYLQTPTKIQKNLQLTTIRTLRKEYYIYFEVRPTSFKKAWQSILHLTTEGNVGVYGYRTPGIWCWDSNLYICSAISGNTNYCYGYETPTPLEKEIWIDIKITQKRIDSDYWYSIYVGGKEMLIVKNTKPQEFSNVKVYVGDPWYSPLNGYIRDLYIGAN